MLVKIWLIRHGMTPGNATGRYVGRTDEALSQEGRKQLEERLSAGMYPMPDSVYVSPMKRCRETAEILFPFVGQKVLIGMQECDFGEFEYKNYAELNGIPAYQAWIDSGGTAGFPGGESLTAFSDRVTAAFDEMAASIAKQSDTGNEEVQLALVVHGGTIMAILDRYARPHKDYFEWQAKNGGGYVVELDTEKWINGDRYLTVQASLEVAGK